MPRYWYDYHSNKLPDNPSRSDVKRRKFNLRILADKKPYFMRYIYPTLMKEYNAYIKNTNVKCLREFRMDLAELLAMDKSERTQQQNDFIWFYHSRMPVGMNDCVMNRVCRRFEAEFDGFIKLNASNEGFDYSILKDDSEYTRTQYYTVAKLYDQHNARMKSFSQLQKRVRVDSDGFETENIRREFTSECLKVCSNANVLCNIVVDMCYQKIGSQQFAWDVCGSEIYSNLLKRSEGKIFFPSEDPDGDILYCGKKFSMKEAMSKHDRDSVE